MHLLMRINNCRILPPIIIKPPQSNYEIISDYLKANENVNKIRNEQLEDLWNRGWMVDKHKWNGEKF